MINVKTALIAGANGIIGENLVHYLSPLPDWDIIGLSRRGGESKANITYISVDLTDKADVQAKLAGLSHVTHVFYAAYQDRPTWAEIVAPNLAMLTNLVETIENVSPKLEHVSLMQGYKVYGAHLGPFKTPAKEDDAGHLPPEFNMDQQNFLEAAQKGKRWTWSAIRPSVVGGVALGNPMNLAVAIAVYASISREYNLPLRFPGKPGAYHALLEMTDATLLAEATVWAAMDAKCANQAFNINNGDLFRWDDMWPKIARYFGMEVAPQLQMSLATIMADKEPLWKNIIQKYGLTAHAYSELTSWIFSDFAFSWDYDMFADGSKARQFGFHEYVDTEEMFIRIFDELKTRKVIP